MPALVDPVTPAQQFVAMCQPDPGNSPFTLVIAGFNGFCSSCFASGLPSLCYHKPPVSCLHLLVITTGRCRRAVGQKW